MMMSLYVMFVTWYMISREQAEQIQFFIIHSFFGATFTRGLLICDELPERTMEAQTRKDTKTG